MFHSLLQKIESDISTHNKEKIKTIENIYRSKFNDDFDAFKKEALNFSKEKIITNDNEKEVYNKYVKFLFPFLKNSEYDEYQICLKNNYFDIEFDLHGIHTKHDTLFNYVIKKENDLFFSTIYVSDYWPSSPETGNNIIGEIFIDKKVKDGFHISDEFDPETYLNIEFYEHDKCFIKTENKDSFMAFINFLNHTKTLQFDEIADLMLLNKDIDINKNQLFGLYFECFNTIQSIIKPKPEKNNINIIKKI